MDIKNFNVELLHKQKGFGCFVYASRRMGKTFMARYLMYEFSKLKKFDYVFLVSDTSEFNNDFDYIPENHKFKCVDMDKLIRKIEKNQKETIDNKEKKKEIFIIFDDFLASEDIHKIKSNPINKLATLGRHLGISFIALSQSVKGIKPEARKNFDFIFASKSRNLNDVDCLCEEYLSGCLENDTSKTRKGGQRKVYFDLVAEPFSWCVVHNTCQEIDKYNKFVYKYKAPAEVPKFQLQKNKNKNYFENENDYEKKQPENKNIKKNYIGLVDYNKQTIGRLPTRKRNNKKW